MRSPSHKPGDPDGPSDFLQLDLGRLTGVGWLLLLSTLAVCGALVLLAIKLAEYWSERGVIKPENAGLVELLGSLAGVSLSGGFYLAGRRMLGAYGISILRPSAPKKPEKGEVSGDEER